MYKAAQINEFSSNFDLNDYKQSFSVIALYATIDVLLF